MKLLRTLKGFRPLTFTPDGLLLARGYEVHVADLECAQLARVAVVPHGIASAAARCLRLLERILRLGLRSACPVSERTYLLSERTRLWLLDLTSGALRLDHVIARGGRPLTLTRLEGVAGFTDGVCFGEYWENPRKAPVSIWIRDQAGTWRVAYTFPEGRIEHVHALVPDSARGMVWILTGDFGSGAGIWAAREDFREVTPVLVGRQEFRCCWFARWQERVLYATDSPLEPNALRELVLQPGSPAVRSEHRMDISGSSIYACMVSDQLVFSTTVEPGLLTGRRARDLLDRSIGPGIKGPYADLLMGDALRGFTLIGRWHKDRLPSRLAEFGSVSFPSGHNPGRRLYAYFTALAGVDGHMCVFEVP